MAPFPNFVVSCPIMTKFGALIEFDKFSPKSPNIFLKMTSLSSYDVTFCFRLPYPSKFFISGPIWLSFGSGDEF